MHKVTRHVLSPDGATYKSKDEDFLVSDNLDFHPTDVVEDADGSLIVVDTGGWYKICCPTSVLQKPDVLGAIYRVKRVGRTRWTIRAARNWHCTEETSSRPSSGSTTPVPPCAGGRSSWPVPARNR